MLFHFLFLYDYFTQNLTRETSDHENEHFKDFKRDKPNDFPSKPLICKPKLQLTLPSLITHHCSPKQLDEEKIFFESFHLDGQEFLSKKQFHTLLSELAGFPRFITTVLYQKLRTNHNDLVSKKDFVQYWETQLLPFDDQTRFFNALKGQDNYIRLETLLPFLDELLYTHPALQFLRGSPQIQIRYVQTVAARIFYSLNRSNCWKISLSEFKRSNLTNVFSNIERQEDINSNRDFFSYEHFYVIYSKFWDLDTDRDLMISREDLARYSNYALSRRLVNRIFDVLDSQGRTKNGLMSFEDFIYFILSEEDKTTESSIGYWFSCVDLDGDGYISLYEMEYFYEEQFARIIQSGDEGISFEDISHQILDMINPKAGVKISLRDLKSSKYSAVFFNTLFNVRKYLEDQVHPCTKVNFQGDQWDQFATEEYEKAAREQQASDESCLNTEEENFLKEVEFFENQEEEEEREREVQREEECPEGPVPVSGQMASEMEELAVEPDSWPCDHQVYTSSTRRSRRECTCDEGSESGNRSLVRTT